MFMFEIVFEFDSHLFNKNNLKRQHARRLIKTMMPSEYNILILCQLGSTSNKRCHIKKLEENQLNHF